MKLLTRTLAIAVVSTLPLTARCGEVETGQLRLTLTDGEGGPFLPGVVQIRGDDGELVEISELLNRGRGVDRRSALHEWWVLDEPTTLTVPVGSLEIAAQSGLETERTVREVECSADETVEVTIPLSRFYNAATSGWVAGNTHLHLQKLSRAEADRYLRAVPLADGLEIVFLSYLERAIADSEYTSNHYWLEDLARLSDARLRFGNGEEHRHNFGAHGEGFGHILLLDIPHIIHPVSIGPGITHEGTDAPALAKAIEATHDVGGKVVWAHNLFGFEDVPQWILGRVHANNIFDGGTRGSYKDSFYRYLNVGLEVPFSSGTDWFIYDYCRVYVKTARPVTAKGWLADLAAGRSYISNGPLLEFRVGTVAIGETIDLTRRERLQVTGRGVGRADFGRLELVLNGDVVARAESSPEAGHFVAELATEVAVEAPCWLALRTPPPPVASDAAISEPVNSNAFGAPLFGHTSPIYVTFNGKRVFDVPTAQSLVDEMQKNIGEIEQQATFADDVERDEVLDVYRRAIERLEARITESAAGS